MAHVQQCPMARDETVKGGLSSDLLEGGRGGPWWHQLPVMGHAAIIWVEG